MHPKQAKLLSEARELQHVLQPRVLWAHYDASAQRNVYCEDPSTLLRSPFSGRLCQMEPVREPLLSKRAASLYQYTTPEGKTFYLSEKITQPMKSPFTGTSFSPNPKPYSPSSGSGPRRVHSSQEK